MASKRKKSPKKRENHQRSPKITPNQKQFRGLCAHVGGGLGCFWGVLSMYEACLYPKMAEKAVFLPLQ